MQLRLKSKYDRSLVSRKFVIKTILFIFVFFAVIFVLDKIDMPYPNKLIKQKITNDKLITLK